MKFLLSLLGIAYAFCPYDLFPDFFLGVGWIDDLIILGLIWWFFFGKKKFNYRNNRDGAQESSSQSDRESSSEPQDPYVVLGLEKNASPEEIKIAYKNLANQYHPDKVLHLGEEFRELAEIRFKEIQKAYSELKPK
jgi:uncharacterized membrane protein YkvA (DUF1232 family)